MKIVCLPLLMFLLSWPSGAGGQELPSEFVKLREQYLSRVEVQTAPVRKVYLQELEKLEKRLAQQGKLEDALAVKSEREALQALRQDPGELAKANTKEELAKVLENTTWSYVANVPDKQDETFYIILLDKGRAYFSWDHSVGTWQATATNRIELIAPARGAKSEMKVTADLSSWSGSYSLDAFRRFGKRIGATQSR